MDVQTGDDLRRILPGEANWHLYLLPRQGPDAATLCERCRERGVFLRDSGATSAALGSHALRVAVKEEEVTSEWWRRGRER